MIPSVSDLDKAIPVTAKKYLEQAIDCLHAPDGAVMLANSAIDAMLQSRGLTQGSVHKRLKDAVSQGLLTEEIRKWADIVRGESNNPRHADKDNPHVSLERARLMVEFASQLAKVLFVIPAQAQLAENELSEDDEGSSEG